MFSFSEVVFLGNVIAQFQKMSDKPVNYPYFLYNYFEKVPSECWPKKKEIMKSISNHLPKSLESLPVFGFFTKRMTVPLFG